MSNELQFSGQLANELLNLLEQHDEATKDPAVASQYLTATVGFLLGQQDMPLEQKHEIVGQLAEFTTTVVNDVHSFINKPQASEPQTPPPQQEPFGVWKPE